MGDAKAVYKVLTRVLRELNAQEAKVWVIERDGAQWIWNHAGNLAKELGFDIEKIVEIVDIWHAKGYL
jgi:hypothetical protein